jgi:hypothetical protein
MATNKMYAANTHRQTSTSDPEMAASQKRNSEWRGKTLILLVMTALVGFPLHAMAGVVLGTAADFAVLGHTTVTNRGPTVIFGSAATLANVGVFNLGNAGDASTGFSSAGNTFAGPGSNTNGPGVVNAPAAIHLGDGVASQARNDLFTSYNALKSYGTATNETGHDLGTSGTNPIGTLVAGVYSFSSTVQLNGVLQLDAQGTNGGVWIFQIGTDLTTASASAVQLINPGSNLGADVGVYWVLGTSGTGGSATLGTTTAFEGNILALTSITLNTGATIYNGRALAENGAVTLDSNVISDICPSTTDLPADVTSLIPAVVGSTAPNSGPGFSGGLVFNAAGILVPISPSDASGTQVPAPSSMTVVLLGGAVLGLFALGKRLRARIPKIKPRNSYLLGVKQTAFGEVQLVTMTRSN